MNALKALILAVAILGGTGPALAQGRGLGPPPGVIIGPPMGLVGPPRGAVGPPMGIVGPPAGIGGLGGGPPVSLPPAAGGAHGLGVANAPGQAVRDAVQAAHGAAQAAKDTVQDTVQSAQDSVGRPSKSGVALANTARDDRGQMIVSDEVLAVSPSNSSLAIARRLNFTVERRDDLGALGMTSATLRVPAGMNAVDALAALRRADPGGAYDYAHIYNPSGSPVLSMPGQGPDLAATGAGLKLGMIDGGIEKDHAAFRDADLVTRGFAQGSHTPATSHGTAVASLLVGHDGEFSGYAAGASLYAADVFGGAADGGSADNIARALNWLASKDIAVTNISLAGPPNALLAAVVKAYVASGHVLVAAAGNNGPAAPASYPAAYPGVISVTSVDGNRHPEIDASGGSADFAALGVNVRAANMPEGYAGVTGTSFAAPLVTARFALLLRAPGVEASKAAFDLLSQSATPLTAMKGAPGYLDTAFRPGVSAASASPR